MEELGKALAEAVRAGAPIAANAIVWYFVRDIINSVLVSVTLLTGVGIVSGVVYKLVRNYHRLVEEGKAKF